MVIDPFVLALASTLGIVLLGPALTALLRSWWGRPLAGSTVASLPTLALGWAAWLAVVALTRPEFSGLLLLPLTALAGVGAILATAPLRLLGFTTPPTLIFAGLWTVAVYSPVAISVMSTTGGVLARELGTLDLAGALPVLVASGAAGLAVLIVDRGAPSAVPAAPSSSRRVALTFVLIWLLWVLWLIGMELALDVVTSQIILNAAIAPVASATAWLVVQRIRHARTTPTAAVGGLFCGLVAIAPGAGFLNVIGAVLTGLIAGALCSLVGYALVGWTGQPAWLLVTILVGGASIGVGLVGAFATRAGLIFTGQPEVLFSQFASASVVLVYAVVVSLLLWVPLRLLAPRQRAPISAHNGI